MIHDWTKVRLKDVCSRITVGHVGSMANCYIESGVPFLRSQNILPFRLHMQDVKYVSKEFHESLRKSVLRAGDVAIVRTGYPGTACVIPEGMGEVNCADLVVITPSSNLNPYFLAAVFNSSWGKASVAGNLVGVAQQHFNVGAAKEMEISLPPRAIQNRIAAILSAYDDLIENNTRRIAVLEEMARRIYEEWFVHFRYPGHEQDQKVETELGLVPEGWAIQTVENTFEILGGGTPSKAESSYWENGDINWYSPTDLTRSGSKFMACSGSKINALGLKKSSARLFPVRSVMMTSRATLGVIAVNTTEACTNQGFITCIPNEKFPLWSLYHWLTQNADYFASIATGSTFKEITKGVFKTTRLAIAPAQVIHAFEANVSPLMDLVLNLETKNANLRQTRDLLLPRLISGELDVSTLVLPDAV
ncbi:restriction endonuclease subunit S [Iodobacter fluviatilis]|uniref:Restriction endonuclease subunit S n=1 Tax=Iodobacter fluviatilis TaxID=537 RepID=A0A7G3GAB5_9NEIS|nr:restriction endonuclease subunit S [Iodobacter fluviatilis]QBC44023.1 restriction endonuclease subunit S [Iodobacter fluviatilis]